MPLRSVAQPEHGIVWSLGPQLLIVRVRHGFRALWQDARVSSPPTIAPVLVAELLVEGERWPVYVHVIDHPDSGMTELHAAVADMDPRLLPLSEQAFDLS
jgi:hypothetical protein